MVKKCRASLLLVLCFLAAGAAAWAVAASAGCTSFDSNGDPVGGWYWLRSTGHKAVWTFNSSQLAGAKSHSVFVNVNALVTDKRNGGAGFDTTLHLKIEGNGTQNLSVILHNTFKPQDAGDSGGLGYQCYGSSQFSIRDSLWRQGGPVTITASYPFPKDRHVGVNKDSVTLGFRK
jgi:hypothetical protein